MILAPHPPFFCLSILFAVYPTVDAIVEGKRDPALRRGVGYFFKTQQVLSLMFRCVFGGGGRGGGGREGYILHAIKIVDLFISLWFSLPLLFHTKKCLCHHQVRTGGHAHLLEIWHGNVRLGHRESYSGKCRPQKCYLTLGGFLKVLLRVRRPSSSHDQCVPQRPQR
jgi:hypothetical protein